MHRIELAIPSGAPHPRGLVAEFFRRDALYAGAAAILIVAIGPTLTSWALDDRLLDGVAVWIKPLKFQLALAVYLATLAWFAGWMPAAVAGARHYRIFAAMVVACVAAEMVWIVGAAALGEASHFNVVTPARQAIYSAMGAAAVMLTSASLVQGVVILRARDGGGDPALRLAIGLGLVLNFALTVPVAGYLSSRAGHLVGADPATVRRLAVFGWARDGGDLRVAHFLATHAMHALPALGWLAARALAPRAARIAVLAGAAVYAALVAWTFALALMGQPFLPWLG